MKTSILLLSAAVSCAALALISLSVMNSSDRHSKARVAIQIDSTSTTSTAESFLPTPSTPTDRITHPDRIEIDEDPNPSRISSMDAEAGDARELRNIASRHDDAETRQLALEELADADTPETLDALIEALDDASPNVVLAAIEALEMVDGTVAIAALDQVARAHFDERVREAALDAIEFME